MEPQSHDTPGIARVLRVGTALCMIGHGALGIGRVAVWTSYFAVVGIGRETALGLMPLVGVLDVVLGLIVLFYPIRAVVLYVAAWSLWTALLRPLAGEPVWETVERAGNYGVPLALLLMGGFGASGWLRPVGFGSPGGGLGRGVAGTLRLTTVLVLLGHGILGAVVGKPVLAMQYAHVGLGGPWAEPLIGCAECALAAAVLLRPSFGLLLFVVGWKLATEALSPISGTSLWVFVEHGGSYAAPLAMALALRTDAVRPGRPVRPSSGRSCSPARS
jgi:hypothetical protein